MKRTLYDEFLRWKAHSARLPLILRGARQVGKSYLVESFGKREFDHLHVINFEQKPQLSSCFDSLQPSKILAELELQLGERISIGNSLLFLDEIQDSPQALKALRYFAEKLPDLHIIAAGSLLEFILEDNTFSFPVGRVQIMNLNPLSFSEYLLWAKEEMLVDMLKKVENGEEISESIHLKLLDLIREYFLVGGMPGVVTTFHATNSYLEVKRRQSAIMDLYALDFGKYATRHAAHRQLKKLFEQVPALVGRHFKYSKIDPSSNNPAREYKEALVRLNQARLVLQVFASKGNGLPLKSEKNDKKFKLFLLDCGLLTSSLEIDGIELEKQAQSSIYKGIIAEQFVAQELIALQDPYLDRDLYFWENLKHTSSAEIDFLTNIGQQIIPIEVKSSASGHLKSLKQFVENKKVPFGVQISEQKLKFQKGLISLPFYLIEQIPRLLTLMT